MDITFGVRFEVYKQEVQALRSFLEIEIQRIIVRQLTQCPFSSVDFVEHDLEVRDCFFSAFDGLGKVCLSQGIRDGREIFDDIADFLVVVFDVFGYVAQAGDEIGNFGLVPRNRIIEAAHGIAQMFQCELDVVEAGCQVLLVLQVENPFYGKQNGVDR